MVQRAQARHGGSDDAWECGRELANTAAAAFLVLNARGKPVGFSSLTRLSAGLFFSFGGLGREVRQMIAPTLKPTPATDPAEQSHCLGVKENITDPNIFVSPPEGPPGSKTSTSNTLVEVCTRPASAGWKTVHHYPRLDVGC